MRIGPAPLPNNNAIEGGGGGIGNNNDADDGANDNGRNFAQLQPIPMGQPGAAAENGNPPNADNVQIVDVGDDDADEQADNDNHEEAPDEPVS